eukprot:Awhi_evm1s14147
MLKRNRSLEALRFNHNLTPSALRSSCQESETFNFLKYNKHLKCLILEIEDDNQLDYYDIQVAEDGMDSTKVNMADTFLPLSKNTSLISLNLQNSDIDDTWIAALCLGLQDLTRASLEIISKALMENCLSLRFLNLNSNRFTSVDELLSSLSRNTSLQMLDLNYNRIETSDVTFKFLETNTTLLSLPIYEVNKNYSAQNACLISKLCCHLKYNNSLSVLDLRCNSLLDVEAQLLVECLKDNKALEYLDLRQNKIGDTGFRDLFGAIVHHPCLKYLHLGGNHPPKESTHMHSSLVKLICENQTLSVLKILS